jgi:hypothetical protein
MRVENHCLGESEWPMSIEIEITANMESRLESLLKGDPFFLETEMLQGEKEILPNGNIKYKIRVEDEFKKVLLREFSLKMISHSPMVSKQ